MKEKDYDGRMRETDVVTSYLRDLFDMPYFEESVRCTKDAIIVLRRDRKIEALAFSGISGAMMAGIISHDMHLHSLCVRKPDDTTHHQKGYQGRVRTEGMIRPGMHYLMIDDFVDTGATVERVKDAVEAFGGVFVGCLCYHRHGSDNSTTRCALWKASDLQAKLSLHLPDSVL